MPTVELWHTSLPLRCPILLVNPLPWSLQHIEKGLSAVSCRLLGAAADEGMCAAAKRLQCDRGVVEAWTWSFHLQLYA